MKKLLGILIVVILILGIGIVSGSCETHFREIHGIVDNNGNIIAGGGFSVLSVTCAEDYSSCQTNIVFNTSFTALPTCVATAYPSSTGDFVTATIVSVIISQTGISVRYQQPIPDYPYSAWMRSGITFICIK